MRHAYQNWSCKQSHEHATIPKQKNNIFNGYTTPFCHNNYCVTDIAKKILLILWYVSLLNYSWTDGSAGAPLDANYAPRYMLSQQSNSACRTPICIRGLNLTGPT